MTSALPTEAHRRSLQFIYSLILILFAAQLTWLSATYAPTYDEIAHLPSRISHWRWGTFDLYRVNPPLVRMLATAPAVLSSDLMVTTPEIHDGPFARPEFSVGAQLLNEQRSRSFWQFTMARWACIPLSLIGACVAYQWAKTAFGVGSGWIALISYSFCPNLLAWGATITPDAGAAALGCAAGWAYWQWWRQPNWKHAAIAGGLLGLAELSKSTWILLFPLWLLLWPLRFTISSQRNVPGEEPIVSATSKLKQLAVILILGLYVLNLGYGFENSLQPLKQFNFISQSLGGASAHSETGNRFRGSWLGELPVPVPENYLRGIDVQKYDFEVGKWSYLRGEPRKGGWWYYYLYAFVVKTPVGILLLLALTVFLTVFRAQFRQSWRSEIVLLAPAVAVFLLVSSQTGFNRYYRYVLPGLPFLYIWISKVGLVFSGKSLALKGVVAASLAWSVVSNIAVLPFSMSYFNEFAGGPRNGWKHLADANIDWGQDLLGLKRWYDQHPEARPFHLAYFGMADPHIAEIDFQPVPTYLIGENGPAGSREWGPQPGWHAVSVNHMAGYKYYESDLPYYTYFQRIRPVARIGYSIYIYHLDADQTNALRTELGL